MTEKKSSCTSSQNPSINSQNINHVVHDDQPNTQHGKREELNEKFRWREREEQWELDGSKNAERSRPSTWIPFSLCVVVHISVVVTLEYLSLFLIFILSSSSAINADSLPHSCVESFLFVWMLRYVTFIWRYWTALVCAAFGFKWKTAGIGRMVVQKRILYTGLKGIESWIEGKRENNHE